MDIIEELVEDDITNTSVAEVCNTNELGVTPVFSKKIYGLDVSVEPEGYITISKAISN
jgi:hypothetical protein